MGADVAPISFRVGSANLADGVDDGPGEVLGPLAPTVEPAHVPDEHLQQTDEIVGEPPPPEVALTEAGAAVASNSRPRPIITHGQHMGPFASFDARPGKRRSLVFDQFDAVDVAEGTPDHGTLRAAARSIAGPKFGGRRTDEWVGRHRSLGHHGGHAGTSCSTEDSGAVGRVSRRGWGRKRAPLPQSRNACQ